MTIRDIEDYIRVPENIFLLYLYYRVEGSTNLAC